MRRHPWPRLSALGMASTALMVICGVAACSDGSSSPSVGPQSDTGFVVRGNPESAAGATWTFRGTVDGTTYDLAGVLLKPLAEYSRLVL